MYIINKKVFILMALIILVVSINESMAYRKGQPYSVKWIAYDSTGNFSAGYYDEEGRPADVIRKPQLFITNKEVPYDKNDLSSVSYGEIEIANKSDISIEGFYKPVMERQEYPFIDEGAFRQLISRDTCYFIACPAPAVLFGYDNELQRNCTKTAQFICYDYLQTLVNYTDQYTSFFQIEIIDSKTMTPLKKANVKVKDADFDKEQFLDSICHYLGARVCSSILRLDYLKELRNYYDKKAIYNEKIKVRDSTMLWLHCALDENMNLLPNVFDIDIDAYGFPDYSVTIKANPNIKRVMIILDKNADPELKIIEKNTNQ